MLYKAGLTIFHASDAANLWQLTDPHLLHITLERFKKYELIYRIYRGLYSLDDPEKLDPILLGYKAIHDYCYLSTESVLFKNGYISRKIDPVTFISSKSKKFRIRENLYYSRQMDDKFLFNTAGIEMINGVPTASAERAATDILYYNPLFHFDREPDWKIVQKLQEEIGYPLTKNRYK